MQNATQNINSKPKAHFYTSFCFDSKATFFAAFLASICAPIFANEVSNSIVLSPPPIESNDNSQDKNSQHIQEKMLEKVVATGYKQEYSSSAGKVDRTTLDSIPAGNGDIVSALKILPNVVSNNASASSKTPGEISPANVSISGGLPYQNNFLLDGFEINNDLDPAGSSSNTQPRQRSALSQGLNVDTSLLDSITVLDSNVSAAYGRFSGGVVEANIRKPRLDKGITNGWHANLSYQYTSSAMTTYYELENSALAELGSSANENYQPNFYKNLIRASIEGWISKNLGLIASYSTVRSIIPLQSYNNGTSEAKQDQKRISDNYYIKLNYNPLENLTLEYSFAYMPQDNTYFTPNFKNSRYTMKQGGIQTGAKALWQTSIGLWTNSLSYSRLENSRKSDVNYYTMINGSEGQYGSVNQIQNNINLKTDFAFSTLSLGIFSQDFRVGLEAIYADATRDRTEDSHMYIYGGQPQSIPTGSSWNGLPDSFGFISANATQFYHTMGIIKAGKTGFDTFTYAIFAEDSASLDLGRDKQGGELKARFGLRLDGDNYMKKHKIAPRFSLSYITPATKDYQSTLTFGANRYYGRNLLAYRFYSDAINNRKAYWRCGVNDAWNELAGTTPNCNSDTLSFGTISNGIVQTGNKIRDLEVPYDDELMGAITQNLGIFSVVLKYIHRDGKDQITTSSLANTSEYWGSTYMWGNDGRSRSDIITLMLQNLVPLQTYGIKHFYVFGLDWSNTSRNFNTHSADYDLANNIVYNGRLTTYEAMPAQKYNQPLSIKLNTTHTFNLWRTKWLLNNFFSWRGTYQRIVLDKLGSTSASSCSSTNTGGCYQFSDKTLGNIFNWDMKLGFELDLYKGQTLYANFDIYNVLGSKNLVTLSGEDGVLLYDVPSNAAVLGYSLGRQFWLQVGYKF